MSTDEPAASAKGVCAARLFDANGADRTIECGRLHEVSLSDDRLLWVDLLGARTCARPAFFGNVVRRAPAHDPRCIATFRQDGACPVAAPARTR